MSNIPIQKFEAEYRQGKEWRRCEVVGIFATNSVSACDFVVIAPDDDGNLWAATAETVRLPQPRQPRRPSA
jgi:hypothetical protein